MHYQTGQTKEILLNLASKYQTRNVLQEPKKPGPKPFLLTESEKKWLVTFFLLFLPLFWNFYYYDRSPFRLSLIGGAWGRGVLVFYNGRQTLTTLSDIPWDLYLSRQYFHKKSSLETAFSHISWVLWQLGKKSNIRPSISSCLTL